MHPSLIMTLSLKSPVAISIGSKTHTGETMRNKILTLLEKEKSRLARRAEGLNDQIRKVRDAINALGAASNSTGHRGHYGHKMSAAARAKISKAQKARWAAKKK